MIIVYATHPKYLCQYRPIHFSLFSFGFEAFFLKSYDRCLRDFHDKFDDELEEPDKQDFEVALSVLSMRHLFPASVLATIPNLFSYGSLFVFSDLSL